MKEVKAFDVNNVEIKRGDTVKIIEESEVNHGWLKLGNTYHVAYWEDRSMGMSKEYICVFLQSKKGGRLCSMGMQDKRLEVIASK